MLKIRSKSFSIEKNFKNICSPIKNKATPCSKSRCFCSIKNSLGKKSKLTFMTGSVDTTFPKRIKLRKFQKKKFLIANKFLLWIYVNRLMFLLNNQNKSQPDSSQIQKEVTSDSMRKNRSSIGLNTRNFPLANK